MKSVCQVIRHLRKNITSNTFFGTINDTFLKKLDMKKLSLLFGLLLMLFLTSCRDIVNSVLDVLPPFEVPFTTQLEVPFASISTTSYTKTPNIPMNIDLDAKIKENDPRFSINNLKSVQLSSLSIDYVNSSLGNKLDVIRNARIYVKAPYKEEILIATAYNNTSADKIVFTPTNSDILEYFRTNQNDLVIEIQGSKITADKITMKLNTGFKVKVQL